MVVREDIGPEVTPRDIVISGELDSRPPLGIEQNLLTEPVRDELLACGLVAEGAQFVGESSLASASSIDGALQRGNVCLLHERRRYTRILVDVNNETCLTANKEPCTVLYMPATKQKSSVRKRRQTEPTIGADGKTLPQRLHSLMVERGVGQSELARMCSEFYMGFVPGLEEPPVQQQHIFNLLQGQNNAWCLPLIAAVFDVNDLWLQMGIGPRERAKP